MSIFYELESKEITLFVCETSMISDDKILYERSLRYYKYMRTREWVKKDVLVLFAFIKHMTKTTRMFVLCPSKDLIKKYKEIIQDGQKASLFVLKCLKNAPEKLYQFTFSRRSKVNGLNECN